MARDATPGETGRVMRPTTDTRPFILMLLVSLMAVWVTLPGAALAVFGSALFATLFPVGAIGGIYAAVRRWMKKFAIRRRRELEH